MKGVGRDHDQRAHCRHVERGAQRRARGHPALELAVVVLRDVQATGRGDLRVRIFDQGGRRDAPFGNGLGVERIGNSTA